MNVFFRGLAAILPISGTIYLIYLLFISIENMGNKTLSSIFGQSSAFQAWNPAHLLCDLPNRFYC